MLTEETKIKGNRERMFEGNKTSIPLAALEQHYSQLTESTNTMNLALSNLFSKTTQSNQALAASLQDCSDKLSTAEQTYKQLLESKRALHEETYLQIANLKSDIAQVSALEQQLLVETRKLEEEDLANTLTQQTLSTEQTALSNQVQEKTDEIHGLRGSIAQVNDQVLSLQQEETQLKEALADLHRQKLESFKMLKHKNNQLQQLKGNIRVFCRVKPSTAPTQLQVSEREVHVLHENKTLSYYFDRVFDSSASQSTVFEEVSQLIQSALDGFNVCIFAYGQTGSGKTYTMEGPSGVKLLAQEDCESSEKGLIQRSVEQLFKTKAQMQLLGWDFTFQASCIEIYNEEVRDLLQHSKKITAFSTNLIQPTSFEVAEYQNLFPLLATARVQRKQAQTKCNSHSSRSHCIFQMKIVGVREGETSTGVLNIIDLAGSERLKMSQAEGERLEETKSINKSLSALGKVIQALVNKDKHVPYRDSKLTAILQNCLGGDGKTLMFVNISPDQQNTYHTICSLRFAQKVTACTLPK